MHILKWAHIMLKTKQGLTLTLNVKRHFISRVTSVADHLSLQTLFPVIYADDRNTDQNQHNNTGFSYRTSPHPRKARKNKQTSHPKPSILNSVKPISLLAFCQQVVTSHSATCEKELLLITQLFEKTAQWQLGNTQLAPGTPGYGHWEQLLRTSLHLVLTNTQVCAFYVFSLQRPLPCKQIANLFPNTSGPFQLPPW